MESVQQIGEFAIRGEVVDIFAPNHAYPIRINLFDDIIENIIYFDHINLATISKLDHLEICPAKDVIIAEKDVDEYIKILSSMAEKSKENKLYELLSLLEINRRLPNEYLSLLGAKFDTIFDYFKGARVVVSNPLHIKSQFDNLCNEQIKLIENLFNSPEIRSFSTF